MKEKLSALLTGNKQAFEDILIHQFKWMTLQQVLTTLFWGGEDIILGVGGPNMKMQDSILPCIENNRVGGCI